MRSDAELVRAARSDPAAFRELYDRYATQIHAFHLRRTRDVEAAHDLTAETFAQAWLSRRRFRDRAGGSAGPWLVGIARHVVSQSVRRRRIERAACAKLGILERLDDGPRATAEPDEEWLEGLDEALAELPEGERAALHLRFAEDLSYEDVGAGLGTSAGAARVRVTRGLGRLRQRLNDQGEALR